MELKFLDMSKYGAFWGVGYATKNIIWFANFFVSFFFYASVERD